MEAACVAFSCLLPCTLTAAYLITFSQGLPTPAMLSMQPAICVELAGASDITVCNLPDPLFSVAHPHILHVHMAAANPHHLQAA